MNRSFLLTIVLLLGLSAGLAEPERARACSAPQGWVGVRDVPANGVVLLEIRCEGGPSSCYGESLPSELPVIDLTTSEPVAGTIVHQAVGSSSSSVLIAFKPDQPLIEGRSYEVMWQPAVPPTFEVDYVLEALAPTPLTAEDVAVNFDLSMVADPLYESVGCTSEEKLGSCSLTHQVTLTTKLFPTVSAALAMNAVPAGSEGQVVVTMAFWAEGEAEPAQTEVPAYLHHTIANGRRFDAKHSAYCYRVEVTSLIDDSFARYEDCLEHGTMSELVELPTSESVLIRQLGTCDDPPEGLLREWCIGKGERCEELGDVLASCGDVTETCADVPMDPDEQPPTQQEPDGGAPDDGVEDPIVDAGDRDETPDAPEPDDPGEQGDEQGDEPEVTPGGPTSSGGSCAVRDGRSNGAAIGAWIALTALAFAMRRVRKDVSV